MLTLPVELLLCIMGFLIEAEPPQAVRRARAAGLGLPSPFRHLVAARSTCKLLRKVILGVASTATTPLRGVPHGLWLSDAMILSTAAKSNYKQRMAPRALATVKSIDVATANPINEAALIELLRGRRQVRALTLHDASKFSTSFLNGKIGGFHALAANLCELRLCDVGSLLSATGFVSLDYAGLVVACPHLTVLALERVRLRRLDDAVAHGGGDDGETTKVAALKSLELVSITPESSAARLLNARDGPVASSLRRLKGLRTNMLSDDALNPATNPSLLRQRLQHLERVDVSGSTCTADCALPPLTNAKIIRANYMPSTAAAIKLITPAPPGLEQWYSMGTPSSKGLVQQLAKCPKLTRGFICSNAVGHVGVSVLLRENFPLRFRIIPPASGRMAYGWV